MERLRPQTRSDSKAYNLNQPENLHSMHDQYGKVFWTHRATTYVLSGVSHSSSYDLRSLVLIKRITKERGQGVKSTAGTYALLAPEVFLKTT